MQREYVNMFMIRNINFRIMRARLQHQIKHLAMYGSECAIWRESKVVCVARLMISAQPFVDTIPLNIQLRICLTKTSRLLFQK